MNPTKISLWQVPSVLYTGQYVVAVKKENETEFYTSDDAQHPYVELIQKDGKQIPVCTDKIPIWYREVPWHLLAQMRLVKMENLYVFMDYSLDYPTGKAQFIPQLNSIIVTPNARL